MDFNQIKILKYINLSKIQKENPYILRTTIQITEIELHDAV